MLSTIGAMYGKPDTVSEFLYTVDLFRPTGILHLASASPLGSQLMHTVMNYYTLTAPN